MAPMSFAFALPVTSLISRTLRNERPARTGMSRTLCENLTDRASRHHFPEDGPGSPEPGAQTSTSVPRAGNNTRVVPGRFGVPGGSLLAFLICDPKLAAKRAAAAACTPGGMEHDVAETAELHYGAHGAARHRPRHVRERPGNGITDRRAWFRQLGVRADQREPVPLR